MALTKDGRIDTKRIEKELVQAIIDDTRYVKTDEMKKRAVHTARNYDEFRHMVACACQKPVSREEMESLGKPRSGWTSTSGSKGLSNATMAGVSDSAPRSEQATLGRTKCKPNSSMEFERDWLRAKGGPQERWSVLQSVGSGFIRNKFRADMSAELLGDIVDVLHYALEEASALDAGADIPGGAMETASEVEVVVRRFLQALTHVGRFDLVVKLMDRPQKEKACGLVRRLWGSGTAQDDDAVQKLIQAFL